MLVIVEDTLEILAVYEQTDDFRTNDLKEEELFRAKIFVFSSYTYEVVFRSERFYSDLCVENHRELSFIKEVLSDVHFSWLL